MLTEETFKKLHEMRLSVMAQALREQCDTTAFDGLSFEERFGLLVDREWAARQSNKLTRLMKQARYPISGACLEDVQYTPERNLSRDLILKLATCDYIQDRHNVLILGATGVGKTYLACALGVQANRQKYSARYVRLPDLLTELTLARAEGNYDKVMRQYEQYKLLILDEWLLFKTNENETSDLLRLLDTRHYHASTIFCSQYDVAGWQQMLGSPMIADAICDRVAHNAYRIKLQGGSMRKQLGMAKQNAD